MTHTSTDEEIAHQVQRGKKELFGVLIERYEGRLIRYARKFLLERQDAEDKVQEVFIKAYVNIQSFQTSRKFSSWIYRIAHNEFINAIKKRSGESIFFFDPDTIFPHPLSRDEADSEATRRETKELLDQTLQKIDPKYREVLVLYYYEDLDYKTISEILEIPISTVGVRLKRGKESMRKIIEQHDPSRT
ncbi:MAG: RNA polymerase sigma factor [Anaplasmataceae bacterium]|nr:RNA polymerase sigma factor [Anaplasmataceae bacterium]MBS3903619.1 RNA polymerase sigma factor [Anaplasmataceae bacterium]